MKIRQRQAYILGGTAEGKASRVTRERVKETSVLQHLEDDHRIEFSD